VRLAIPPDELTNRTSSLEDVPDGYRAMASRGALKVLIRP
jgi:threonine dehydrogenase-like Zn-dependent dehydrogenase